MRGKKPGSVCEAAHYGREIYGVEESSSKCNFAVSPRNRPATVRNCFLAVLSR